MTEDEKKIFQKMDSLEVRYEWKVIDEIYKHTLIIDNSEVKKWRN